MAKNDEQLKKEVQLFWEKESCGTAHTKAPKHSLAYFEEIERVRYEIEYEIPSFAQFTLAHGKKVLEVGVGAGTDFIQWVRSGAEATGIDLTNEAIVNTKKRLEVYGLPQAELLVADCEALPFADDSFDIVYSMGVVHHSPNTELAIRELVRVCKPGGIVKFMVYNRHSVLSYMNWFSSAFLKGKFTKSLRWSLFNNMESPGTKAYTVNEMKKILSPLPVAPDAKIYTRLTYHDYSSNFFLLRLARQILCRILGHRFGWYLFVSAQKVRIN